MSEYENRGSAYEDDPQQNLGSELRTLLDRDFGTDNEEKLRYVKASLERMRAEQENLSTGDAVNYGDSEISKMVDLENDIPTYELVQTELENILGVKGATTVENDSIQELDGVH